MTYTIKVTYRQKQILHCILNLKLSQTETAKRLGCSISNISSTLFRLKQKFPQLKLNVYQKQFQIFEIPAEYVDKAINVKDTNIK